MSEAELKESLDGWAKDTQREISLLKLDIAEIKNELSIINDYITKLNTYNEKLHKYITMKVR